MSTDYSKEAAESAGTGAGSLTGSRRILIMTAVDAERDAVVRGLRGNPRFDVRSAGVGPVEAAVTTATLLAAASEAYDLVVCAGIAGGFKGQAEIGSLVVASEIVAADLGAQTPDGFLSLDELGFGSSRIAVAAELVEPVTGALRNAGLQAVSAPVLTLSTVTGTAESAEELASRIPGAAAEGMEGFGIAAAARKFGVPVLEIRSISNAVGPRDKAAWRIGDALQSLEAASTVLMEVL
ncbi:futalosine hydrolase [Paenibacillus sp. OAS669]|uniref:futalosine hydrolase n=1 Tax=Paenibacillus sp. OAS669 TaxID=2663821 RepID=UPI00178B3A31|nr:futalosine hydrolase [Paenibacillus sp. OAS669]MBE1444694.1 futalosine hydrolase [Paenibacillus sp. OAS669]